MIPAAEIWDHLVDSPLLWLTATLLAYHLACAISHRLKSNPLANPILLAMLMLGGVLWATDTPYTSYFEGARLIHFLLGPATVALAIPLYLQWHHVKAMALPIVAGLTAGCVAAIASAVLIARWFGASEATLASLAPKSVTTPIAMGIAERIGGLPSLTAVVVILTGILGAIIAAPLFRLLRVRDEAVQGFAIGLAAHGVGTARAFQISEQTGAFAALAIGLNGLLTAVLVPVLLPLLV
ncbi:MAG: LrgB family protein [Betaproteobacteria bacterium]